MPSETYGLIQGKIIMVTGGTGSFGNTVVEKLLDYKPKQIIIFSRDEKKQLDMKIKHKSELLEFIIGDVRDKEVLSHAMRGVNFVFHAAALKQVPNCEFFPMEAVKTNILGAYNVVQAAIDNGVERVVMLSTDKAVYPVNVMGMTKSMMERIAIAFSHNKKSKTIFCCTRYGNVMYTRGSVIPFFIDLIKEGKPLKITNKNMTRFMMSLPESLDLVLYALMHGNDGEIYVKKAPAATVEDVAGALISLFHHSKGMEEVGIRPGEKIHEVLISPEEAFRTEDCGEYYKVRLALPESSNIDYKDHYKNGDYRKLFPPEGYTSENTKRLSVEEIKELLLTVPEIRKEVENLNPTH